MKKYLAFACALTVLAAGAVASAAPVSIAFQATKSDEFFQGSGFSNPNVGAYQAINMLSGVLTFDTDDIATSTSFAALGVTIMFDGIDTGTPDNTFDALGRGGTSSGGVTINEFFFFEDVSQSLNVRFGARIFDDNLDIQSLSNAEIAANFPFDLFERFVITVSNFNGLTESINYTATSFELVSAPEVPLPAAFPLMLAGLAGFRLAVRKKRNSTAA
ncbi:VPLPA-CTERM sorting domain-containing protein [Hyphococcus sp.]|uniref:VPLPA-CTERM sorting domain-containing protein n=1 Tax=Hyphococcus sp. TaxID=2038636 RepID=UPI003CCB7FEA